MQALKAATVNSEVAAEAARSTFSKEVGSFHQRHVKGKDMAQTESKSHAYFGLIGSIVGGTLGLLAKRYLDTTASPDALTVASKEAEERLAFQERLYVFQAQQEKQILLLQEIQERNQATIENLLRTHGETQNQIRSLQYRVSFLENTLSSMGVSIPSVPQPSIGDPHMPTLF